VGEKDDAVFVDETLVAFRALAGRSQVLAAELCRLKRVKHHGLRDKQSGLWQGHSIERLKRAGSVAPGDACRHSAMVFATQPFGVTIDTLVSPGSGLCRSAHCRERATARGVPPR
jgi:hypothetical protein